MMDATAKGSLSAFVPFPRHVIAGRQFRTQHFRVLDAVGVAIDSKSGAALISHKRISVHAGISRYIVREALQNLISRIYLMPTQRDKAKSGPLKAYAYRVIYESDAA